MSADSIRERITGYKNSLKERERESKDIIIDPEQSCHFLFLDERCFIVMVTIENEQTIAGIRREEEKMNSRLEQHRLSFFFIYRKNRRRGTGLET
jgi:hypothetical protein